MVMTLLQKLMGWAVQSKAAKGGIAIGGGSGVVALILALFGHVDNKALETESKVREYVDSKHELVMTEVQHITGGVSEIKGMLKVIDARLYDLKKEKIQ